MRTTSIGLLASMLLVVWAYCPTAEAERRRPVRLPGVVPGVVHTLVPNATPQTDVTITNHGDAATFANCYVVGSKSSCTTETLEAGHTATYADLGSTLGETTPGRIAICADHPLEVRATGPTAELLGTGTKARAPFTNDLSRYENALVIGTTAVSATVRLTLENTNGIPLAYTTLELASWREVRSHLTDLFGVAEQNQLQLQLTVDSGSGLYASVERKDKTTGKVVTFPVRTRQAGEWFLTATPATRAILVNGENTNVPEARLLLLDQQNDSSPFRTVVVNAFSTYHFESQPLSEWISYGPFGAAARDRSGTARLVGVPDAESNPLTFMAWGVENDSYVPAQEAGDGATGRSSVPGDATERKAMSFNILGTLHLSNVSIYSDTVTGRILGYDDAGNQVSSQDYALRNKENKNFTLTAARSIIVVDDAVGSGNTPQVLGMVQNENGVHRPHLLTKPIERVTGEEYVAKWLDPLKQQYFYLSNAEVRCMINGNCGTRSYAPDMAAVLVRATENSSGVPASAVEQALRGWVDGELQNGELDTRYDPLNTSMANNAVGFYFPPANLSKFSLSQADIQVWYGVVRSFLVEHTQKRPDQYGGSVQTGPNLSFQANPWVSQDLN